MPEQLQEFHLKHMYFRQVGGMSAYEIEQMAEKYPIARQTDQGVPVFGMISALSQELREYRRIFGTNLKEGTESASLEYELKHENLLSKKILNQTKLGILILKEEASKRVKDVFRATVNSVKVAIKHSASRLMCMEIKGQRDIEKILTEEYNEAIRSLEEGAKVISWEEDGSHNLLQTRLADLESQDPEFTEVARMAQRGRS